MWNLITPVQEWKFKQAFATLFFQTLAPDFSRIEKFGLKEVRKVVLKIHKKLDNYILYEKGLKMGSSTDSLVQSWIQKTLKITRALQTNMLRAGLWSGFTPVYCCSLYKFQLSNFCETFEKRHLDGILHWSSVHCHPFICESRGISCCSLLSSEVSTYFLVCFFKIFWVNSRVFFSYSSLSRRCDQNLRLLHKMHWSFELDWLLFLAQNSIAVLTYATCQTGLNS